MEGETVHDDGLLVNEVKLEEDEEDFCSCCEDEEELEDSWEATSEEEEDEVTEEDEKESARESCEVDLDEHSIKLFFKGISVAGPGDSGCRISGIGVVMERAEGATPIQIQKKLDFYVEEFVADYLALMDGLLEAVKNKVRKVYALTDSEMLYQQVRHLFSPRCLSHCCCIPSSYAVAFTFASEVLVDEQLPLFAALHLLTNIISSS